MIRYSLQKRQKPAQRIEALALRLVSKKYTKNTLVLVPAWDTFTAGIIQGTGGNTTYYDDYFPFLLLSPWTVYL